MAEIGKQEGKASDSMTNMASETTPAASETAPAGSVEPRGDHITVASQDKAMNTQNNPQKSSGMPTNAMEDNMYKHFMNPMLSKMEESVRRNNEILDNIQRKWDDEREEKRKQRLSKHIPGPLLGNGQKLEDIMHHIQDLLIYENFSSNQDTSKLVPARLKTLDDNTEVAILSHSVAAYVSTLDLSHLRQFTTRIVSDTTLWTSRLFRFNDASAYFHEEEREGLVRVCRLALHRKYPKFGADGYEALYPRPPILYVSAASKPGLGQYLCSQLGLPLSCLCTVPCSTMSGSTHKMDISTLEKLVEDDVASGKTPVLVVAYAGTPLVGHVDNIQHLQDLCKKAEIWLHIEGNNLATLTMFSVPTSISPAKSGDSMTLNLGSWLGLPAVPYITLYKTADPSMAHASGLTSFNVRYKLNSLPIWLSLQNLGHEGVVNRVKHSIDLAKQLSSHIEKIPTIKQVGKKEDETDDVRPPRMGISDLISKAISALIIFEIENPTVVFRYQEPRKVTVKTAEEQKSTEEIPDDSTLSEEDLDKDPYFDALNLWLSETMKREIPKVSISTVEVDGEGICIRFCPLETANTIDTATEDVVAFQKCLDHQLHILNATVKQREDFQAIVAAQDNLRLVNLSNWAGLGAVQYIPEQWVEKLDDLPDIGKKEINQLNTQLVQQLKSADTAFSLGMSRESLACVRFGLITEDTDLEELIALVYTTGREVEESSKFLETMTEIVKQGIERANSALLQEGQDKLVQEGVLRQVPLVGSLLNWWSPPPKEAGIKGRSFNLASGQVESTEGIYKYHMQIQQASEENMSKARQVPLKLNLKPKRRLHSANSTASTIEDVPQSDTSQGDLSQMHEESSAEPAETEMPVETRGGQAQRGPVVGSAATPEPQSSDRADIQGTEHRRDGAEIAQEATEQCEAAETAAASGPKEIPEVGKVDLK